MKKSTFTVAVRRPFRFDLTAMLMRRRSQNRISHWDGRRYQRVIAIGDTPVRITASQGGTANSPQLDVTLESYAELTLDQQIEVQLITQKMFGVSADLQSLSDKVSQDPAVWKMVGQYLGVKPTRFPTIFEAIVTAVACQRTTLETGIELLNRLAETYGMTFNDGVELMHAFPRPEDLTGVTEAELYQLGFGTRKARAIMAIADKIASGKCRPELLELMSESEAYESLRKLPGVSRWAAEYVMIRGLGMLDVFPADDPRAKSYLRQMYNLNDSDYDEVKLLSSAWHPYEGYVYFLLLLEWFRRNGVAMSSSK